MLLVPIGKAGAIVSFPGDLLAFAGLLALARFSTVLAALDTGSSFEGMGASREVMFSAIAEPALLLGFGALAVVSGSLSLSGMLGMEFSSSWGGPNAPALALVAAALFLVLLAENARIPVDDPNTHLELTMVHEVMVLDHSGPDLAYIHYSAALKLWLFASLAVAVLVPIKLENAIANGLLHLIGIAVVAVGVGVVESSIARLRMLQVPHLLAGAGVLSGLGAALAVVVR
jgi:formate hydrogenlyase subunit 4